MNKNISKFALCVIVLASILFIFLPYFTSDFLDLRQKKENEENHQRMLREEKEAKERIYLMGKFDPAQREDFILIPSEYVLDNVNQNKMYLRIEAYRAYLEMQSAASKSGIELKIASATRNFNYQRDLWNNKWNGVTLVEGKNLSKSIPNGLERFKKILEYSAPPGTSRHHFGTEIDLNNANPEYFEGELGKKVYAWLVQNAGTFGFCQTYNQKSDLRTTGYNEEKWHWSYLPLARAFTKEYKNLIKEEDIKGFGGDEYVKEQDLINDYVLSINPDCV